MWNLPCHKVVDLDGELHSLVCRDDVTILRADHYARDHVLGTRDVTHGYGKLGQCSSTRKNRSLTDWVAGSTLNLKTIGNRLTRAEVDEVVRARGRRCLTSLSLRQTIVVGVLGDDVRVETIAVVAATITPVVTAVVLAIVLAIVATIVLTVVLAIVVAFALAVSLAELSIGEACCKQQRHNGGETHRELVIYGLRKE